MIRSTVVLAWCVMACSGCGGKLDAPSDNPSVKEFANPTEPDIVGQQEITIPDPPPNMAETLTKAESMWEIGNYSYVQILNDAKAGFVTIKPATDDALPTWQKITLNRAGVGFDAIRVNVPKGDLIWAVALPSQQFTFDFANALHAGAEFVTNIMVKQNLDVPEIPASERQAFVFQHYDLTTNLFGGDFFLTFYFPDKHPVDAYFKMRCIPRSEGGPLTKPQDIATKLGFEMPFRFAKTSSVADRAQESLELTGLKSAVEILDKEVTPTSSRRDKAYYARLAQHFGAQLAQQRATEEESHSHYLKSAALLHEVFAQYGSFEGIEIEIAPVAFYNEACILALRGDREKAMRSLNDAVDSGFRDAQLMRGDDDLESLRQLPEFQQMLERLGTAR